MLKMFQCWKCLHVGKCLNVWMFEGFHQIYNFLDFFSFVNIYTIATFATTSLTNCHGKSDYDWVSCELCSCIWYPAIWHGRMRWDGSRVLLLVWILQSDVETWLPDSRSPAIITQIEHPVCRLFSCGLRAGGQDESRGSKYSIGFNTYLVFWMYNK